MKSAKLAFYNDNWPLMVEVCPCDVHFTDWLAENRVRDATIYHFGTGAHHHVGVTTHADGSGNRVFGITASPQEYEAYVKLAIERPTLGRSYVAHFGDIYLANADLLPPLDVATLFHLCEFRTEATDAYGGLTDLDLCTTFFDKLRPGGHLLFYTRSSGFEASKPVLAAFEKARPVALRAGEYKTLLVYRKPG